MKADQSQLKAFSVENWGNRVFLFGSEKASPLLAAVDQNPKCLSVVVLLCELGFPVKLFRCVPFRAEPRRPRGRRGGSVRSVSERETMKHWTDESWERRIGKGMGIWISKQAKIKQILDPQSEAKHFYAVERLYLFIFLFQAEVLKQKYYTILNGALQFSAIIKNKKSRFFNRFPPSLPSMTLLAI